ncbi:hypothetical protein BH18ACT12_BH18ACT12_06930 [soil metagenome]
MAAGSDKVEMDGEVLEALGNGMYKIGLDNGTPDSRLHGRKDAALSDPGSSGGSDYDRTVGVRPRPRTYRLPLPLMGRSN